MADNIIDFDEELLDLYEKLTKNQHNDLELIIKQIEKIYQQIDKVSHSNIDVESYNLKLKKYMSTLDENVKN